MKRLRSIILGTVALLVVFSLGVSNVAASVNIPLQVRISPQHYEYKGSSLTNYQKRLSWYDSHTTTYYVTYYDGRMYHYTGAPFRATATDTERVNYYLASGRTSQTWRDELSVTGVFGSDVQAGSITLRR